MAKETKQKNMDTIINEYVSKPSESEADAYKKMLLFTLWKIADNLDDIKYNGEHAVDVLDNITFETTNGDQFLSVRVCGTVNTYEQN